MIKLQLLLRHPHCALELDPALRHRIETLGMRVTGSGHASVSAEIDPAAYESLFGAAPPVLSGCVDCAQDAPALSVPRDLEDAITLITIAARHVPTP